MLEAPRPVPLAMVALHLPRGTPELEHSVLLVSLPRSITRALDRPLYPVDRRLRRKPMKMVRVKKTMPTRKTKICTVSARSSRMERWVLDVLNANTPGLRLAASRWSVATTRIAPTNGYCSF